MLLADVVAASAAVAETRSRLAKVDALADVLRGADPPDVALAISYLSGKPLQDKLGVGWAALGEATPEPAPEPTLTLQDVDAAFAALASCRGSGSTRRKAALLGDLLGAIDQKTMSSLVAITRSAGPDFPTKVQELVDRRGRERFPELFDPALHFDLQHLNARGAQLFSERLAEAFLSRAAAR